MLSQQFVPSMNTTRYMDTVGTNYMMMPFPPESLSLNPNIHSNFYFPQSDSEFENWSTRQVRKFNCYTYDSTIPVGRTILDTIILPMFQDTSSIVCIVSSDLCPFTYWKYRKTNGSPFCLMRMYRTHILRTFFQEPTWNNILRFCTTFLDFRNGHLSRGFDNSQS